MSNRLSLAVVVSLSMTAGYFIGQTDRFSLNAAAAVDPHAGHATADEHAGHVLEGQAAAVQTPAAASNPNLPADSPIAKERLNTSPRHGEHVRIANLNGRPLRGSSIPSAATRRPSSS